MPSFLERGAPSLRRLNPTRFAADAIHWLRFVWVDVGAEGVDVRSCSLVDFAIDCLDDEKVGDMK